MVMSKITFQTQELRRLLANGVLFAAAEKQMVPVLSVVRFDWRDEQLFVVASNRYVQSWETGFPVESDGRDPFNIGIRDVKWIIGMLSKTDRTGNVSVEYDPETRRVEVIRGDEVLRFTAAPPEYHRWERLIGRFTAADKKTVTIGAEWLGLLVKVDGGYKGAPVCFEMGEGDGPVRVSVGESFKAVVVPVTDAG